MTADSVSANGTPAIICENVSKWFGDFQALRDVTVSIDPGEVVW